MTHEPPAVRAATAADRAGIQRLLRELHGEGTHSTTLPEVRAEVVFVSASDDDAAEFYLHAGFTRCSGPWLWAAAGQPA
jgi:hypothetical protein